MNRRSSLTMLLLLAGSLLTVLTGPASAGSPSRQIFDIRPRHAVSLLVPSLGDTGLAMQYEHLVLPDRWSLSGSLAVRSTAGGDYDSLSISVGGELRYWWRGRALWSTLQHTMVGPYVGARLDIERTSLRQTSSPDGDRSLGSMTSLATTVVLGYRFALWRRVEITPGLGWGWRGDIDPSGTVPSRSRLVILAGLTVGWLF